MVSWAVTFTLTTFAPVERSTWKSLALGSASARDESSAAKYSMVAFEWFFVTVSVTLDTLLPTVAEYSVVAGTKAGVSVSSPIASALRLASADCRVVVSV